MHKQTARVVGSLFITATAAGILSAVLLKSLDNTTRISAGALLTLIMAVAIALIPPALFPVLKVHGEALSIGYIVTRTLEVALILPAAIGPLMLTTSHSNTVRELVGKYTVWGSSSAVFFCVSVLFLNCLLYRSKLVPRWISGWALVAVVPYLAGSVLVMFDQLDAFSTAHDVLFAPLALNEMVFAVWLLVKGFRG